MVNTPKARHSKTKRDPVTIDLDPASVSRVPDEAGDVSKQEAASRERTSTTEDVAAAAEPADKHEQPGGVKPQVEGSEPASRPGRTESGATDADESAGSVREEEQQITPPRSRGGGAGFIAGIAGAIVALIVAGALLWAGILHLPSGSGNEDAAIESLRQDVAALRTRLSELKDGAADGAAAGEVTDLSQRVDGLQSSFQAMQADVGKLQEAGRAAPAGAGAEIEALKGQITDLGRQVQDLSQSSGSDQAVDQLQQRVAQIEQGITAARDDAGRVSQNADRIGQIQDRVDQLAQQVEARSEQPAVARLVAATALKSAVDRGVPFEGELQAYSALAPDAASLAPLEEFAAKGVPTRAELAERVSGVATGMVSAAAVDDGNAGVFDRLWNSARALVVVRPVGQPEGDGVPAIAARFESDVRSGDYEKALAEYDKLPPQAKEAASAFAARLKARLAADRLLGQALSGAAKAG